MKPSVPKKIVLIGASTGGPGQIIKIIKSLNLNNTSVVIAQHMINGFLESFAQNLQSYISNKVLIVNNKTYLKSSTIYVCEGETTLEKENNKFVFVSKSSLENNYNPNINIIFNSFVKFSSEFEILVVILTGIGDDGVDACINLNKNSVRCITETKESAIVDGMPSRARLLVSNIEIYDLQEIIKLINEFCE